MRRIAVVLASLAVAANAVAAEFELAAPQKAATILVPASEPECVRLAARDLASDVEKITGRKPAIVANIAGCAADCVVLASADQPESLRLLARLGRDASGLVGKWEAYTVETAQVQAAPIARALVISGSDQRGTMFGVYAFAEQYLGVDPLHFWTGREPQRRQRLAWAKVRIAANEPTFRYRGWFVNDEDLLTEWQESGGKRDIDYPFYHQVTSPKTSARVFEAALRLQYNFIIPASFVDIRNPAEARLIDDATRRGLLVSQHHVEPLGVSAFAFTNYWKSKGEEVPFSFVRYRDKFEATWREYAKMWAKYPGVIWQLGLRGIADRPVWVSDPSVPKSDEARGKLISDAMGLQWDIVRSVDRRAHPPATTTLWMEGAKLHQQGHLRFPPGITVVFSDNSPGWQLQPDFYEVAREPGRGYGIYYHHGLWGSGPHLVQAVSPQRTYGIFKQAVERGSNHYAVLNVANVRELVLGVDASARLLRDFPAYDPDRFLKQWCDARFGSQAGAARACYERFFASYVSDDARGRAMLDGELIAAGKKFYASLLQHAAKPRAAWDDPQKIHSLLAKVERQRVAVEKAGAGVADVLPKLQDSERAFFEVNFVAQQRILLGLVRWLENGLQAGLAMQAGDRRKVTAHVTAAQAAIADIRAAQKLATRGPWENWYRGDKKMNIGEAERLTNELANLVNQL
jgi:hypothetical protein